MATQLLTDIKGIINEINLGEDDVLFPIFEGVVNSIQSISEYSNIIGRIDITIERDKQRTELFEEFERFPIKKITITDNGVGFTPDNFKSFLLSHSTKKLHLGGKGVGRFAMLSVFNTIEISSITDQETNNKVIFSISTEGGIAEPVYSTTKNLRSTTITLTGVTKKFRKSVAKYSQEEIADEIINHCLLYYLNNQAPLINVIEDNRVINLNKQFDPHYYIKHTDQASLCDKVFNLYYVKSTKCHFHELCLCGNNRKVKSKRIDSFVPVLSTCLNDKDESYFLMCYVVSDYLDSIVCTGRNDFNFPKEKELDNDDEEDLFSESQEGNETLSEKSILNLVKNSINLIFQEELALRLNDIRSHVEEFLSEDDGIEFRHIKFSNEFYESLKNGCSDNQIFNALQKYRYKQSLIMRKKEAKLLKRDYSNKEDYQNLLKEYVTLTTQENNSVLAKYVVHRRTIIELLQRYLQWCDDNQNYEEESALHNLIFTMGQSNLNKSYNEHNLWLLDDRLAFHKYIYSDKAIRIQKPVQGKSECAKETDIIIYDIPYCYDDEDEYGKINSIVIFELKRPNRKVTVNEFKDQMKEQVTGILQGKKRRANGANISVPPNIPIFFYYVIDDNAYQSMKDELINFESFHETPYESLVNMNNNIYQEILTYNDILRNAKRRNKIFFDKLGLKTNN